MPDPFTIRIFVPDGDPEGVRLIDRMNWTGLSIAFPRSKWIEVRQRSEFLRAGVYILVGFQEDDLPTIYIGQADGVRNRIEAHFQNKDFWDWGIIFVSNSGGLNRAHVTWLEYALVNRATATGRCRLDNGNAPQEPGLTEAEKADTQAFLKEIFQILPLVGLRAFEFPKAVATPKTSTIIPPLKQPSQELDTIIVPAQKEGFDRVFIGEDCWYAIRISGGMLEKIKYIAAYQTQPVKAITHYAPVDRIEPYGEGGKYKLVFSEKAKEMPKPIPFADAAQGAMQGPRYTTFTKLMAAKKLTDLTDKA
jgi:Uri superfamily endonuclease